MSPALQSYTLVEFAKPTSEIRVLVSTIVFGMGTKIADMRRIIHWDPTSSMLAFWPEIGRGGREGKPATATWYAHGKADADGDRFQKLRLHDMCVRQTVLAGFILPEMDTTYPQLLANRPTCDDACSLLCSCAAMCCCCSYCRRCCPCRSS